MTNQTGNVAVIGAGIIGSWTALHLAETGVRTTLIEQFPLPHTRGSSHGQSRAFRLLGELELDRLDYSLDRWRALEKLTGETLFIKTGLLNFGRLAMLGLKSTWQCYGIMVGQLNGCKAERSPAGFQCLNTLRSGVRHGTQMAVF